MAVDVRVRLDNDVGPRGVRLVASREGGLKRGLMRMILILLPGLLTSNPEDYLVLSIFW